MPQMPLEARTSLGTAAEEALQVIRDSLARIPFGSIAITLHEGRIVQLDITEKKRLGSHSRS